MEVSGRKVDDILCESCLEDGKKLLAVGFCVNCCEYLCSSCYEHHCIPRLYKNHVLQDKETMPRTKPDSMTTEISYNGDKCSKHGGEIIKFYCRSDRQLGCGSYMTVNHRKCDKIISIVEEYENFEKDIKDFNFQIDKNSQAKDQNITDIENTHSQAIKDIKLFMSETKQFIENLENEMITDVDKLKEKNDKKMKNISVTCMTLRNDIQSLTSDLSKLHQTQQNGKLFTIMEEARDQMKKIAKEIDETKKSNKVENYKFVPEKQLQELIGNLTALGNFDTQLKHIPNYQTEMQKTSDKLEDGSSSTKTDKIQTNAKLVQTAKQDKYVTSTSQSPAYPESLASNQSTQATNKDDSTETKATNVRSDVKSIKINSQSGLETEKQKATLALYSGTVPSSSATVTGINQYPFKPRQVSKVTDITVKSSKDKKNPWITGINLLSDDRLVLADFVNHKVKIVNTKQNTIETEIITSSQPWDITTVNNNLVAMTMPYTEHIQLFSVSNKKLSKGQTIKVNGECQGIVHKDGTFIVTYIDPGKLEIMSMSGNVLKVIDKGPNGEPLFALPLYIALSPDNAHVYIKDYLKGTVTCMTFDGKVKGVYKVRSLNRPCGLTVDKSGSVYVVGGGLMYQISGDCSQGQKIQGVGSALEDSITYCPKDDKLFVGGQTDSINVYQLK